MNNAKHHLAADDETIAQPWDVAAAGWNQHAALIHNWLQPVTQMMMEAAHIKLGSRVLDIAAGAGDQTLDIARRVGSEGSVLATDISPAILALAQKNAHITGLKNITTQVADAQALGLAGADFDAALCRLGLMFCQTPLLALTEIRSALKPKGRLSAVVFGEPALNPCLTITLNTARKHTGFSINTETNNPKIPVPGSLMSLGIPGLLEKLMHVAGYKDVSVRHIFAPFHAPSVEQYIDFLRSSASPIIEILACLPALEQQNAWIDMTEQLRVFSSKKGWDGPNGLLLCSATAA